MPYIHKEDRRKFDKIINIVVESLGQTNLVHSELAEYSSQITTVGELNYIISSIAWKYFDKLPSYSRGNSIVDDLEKLKYLFHTEPSSPESVKHQTLFVALHSLLYDLAGEFSGITGVLVCVIFEFYRRKLAPYEDKAIERNGDI